MRGFQSEQGKMNRQIFITGNSTGLGRGLTEAYLEQGDTVYGMSRRGCSGPEGRLFDIRCDIEDGEALIVALEELLTEARRLDLVILNAGVLGRVQELCETTMDEIHRIMEINVWANKRIIDWLKASPLEITQVVIISSGASKKAGRGWGAYAISKAALNMMTGIYAEELPEIHFSAVAPGIIDTEMQEYISTEADTDRFPSLKGLRQARESKSMPSPREAGRRIVDLIPTLRTLPSGSYTDLPSIMERGQIRG